MQMLYDSDKYVVIHQVVNNPDGAVPHDPYEAPRHGFEIVNKTNNMEVFLTDSWAAAFQQQINAWQLKTPTAEEVEGQLERYCELAQLPLVIH